MIVDDDDEAREMLGEFLADEGFVVELAADGASALDKLAGFHADVVVTDFEMPGMSGLELIRRVHERDPVRPALIVSARYDWPRFGGDTAGAPLTYLPKPIDLDALTQLVRKLVASCPGSPFAPPAVGA